MFARGTVVLGEKLRVALTLAWQASR